MGEGLGYVPLEKRSIKFKLFVAVSLMAIIPILTLVYLISNFIFPNSFSDMVRAMVIAFFVLWLSGIGFILAKKMIIPVIDMANEAKAIANGKLDGFVSFESDDELGDIAKSVNSITDKLRGYLGKLQEYSEETAALNIRIHRKVYTITNLMRLGDMIGVESPFHEIAVFAAQSLAQEPTSGFCAIYVKEKSEEYSLVAAADARGTGKTDILQSAMLSVERRLAETDYLQVIQGEGADNWTMDLAEKIAPMNIIFFPLRIRMRIEGFIVFGNPAGGKGFDAEDMEVLRAYEKELGLALQNLQIVERVKKLEIIDSLTGLYTFAYVRDRLEDEINRALYYQRPCSFLLIDVDDYKRYSERFGEVKSKHLLKLVGMVLSGESPLVGKVGRQDDEFAMLLPEMNKREAIDIAEKIRKKIEDLRPSNQSADKVTVSIGVGENPIDGSSAKEIVEKARSFMGKAKQNGKNRVLGE